MLHDIFLHRLASIQDEPEETVLSPAETLSPEPVFEPQRHMEEIVIPKEEIEAMRPRAGSGGAAKPAGHGTSFVQSAAYREKTSSRGSSSSQV